MLFSEYQKQFKQLRRVLGPWTLHVHSFGCDCGNYAVNSQYHGDWWYRETLDGREAITAFSQEDKQAHDIHLREEGYLLCDE